MSAIVYAGARYEHLERLGRGHSFTEFGRSMRALGYHPLYALGRCGAAPCRARLGDPEEGRAQHALAVRGVQAGKRRILFGVPGRVPQARAAAPDGVRVEAYCGEGICAGPRAAKKAFAVVVPFLDTPRGRAFASRSLPSAAALGPVEIIVGADAPAAPDLAGFLAGVSAAGGGGRVCVRRQGRQGRRPFSRCAS